MASAVAPMDEDMLSDSDTSINSDQDIDTSDDDVNEHSWRYILLRILNSTQENKLNDGARPLHLETPCRIRLRQLADSTYSFPLSNTLCSRIICEHAVPLPLSNKYDFCGTKVVNTAWQVSHDSIDFPLPFTAAVREATFERFRLNAPNLNTHFDVNLHKLVILGPCAHSKIYNFDDKLFIYHATILVFLPSDCIGGNYRFINDNLDEDDDESNHRHVFSQQESDTTKPFILIVPSDCQHEIDPINRGFKLLLVYHLISKTNSIHQLYSLTSNSNCNSFNIEHILQLQRIKRTFTYWENHAEKMPTKLIIPLQHHLDYSSYYSMLFREKFRTTLRLISTALKHFPSFLIYSATFQYDKSLVNTYDSRFFIHHLKLLNSANQITLNFNLEHERTVIPNEFLGELLTYIDEFERTVGTQRVPSAGKPVCRNETKYQVLVIIPQQYQWDLLLDDYASACHHLSYLFSLPPDSIVNNSCLNLLDCVLRDRTLLVSSFDKLIHCFILLHDRVGVTTKLLQLLKALFQNKKFRLELFSQNDLFPWLNRLIERFSCSSTFVMELLDLFRRAVSLAMPTNLNEIVRFLSEISNKTIRALFINSLLRFIFKRQTFPKHVPLTTLCSVFYLLAVDATHSDDALVSLAFNMIKCVRKSSSDNEIIEKCLKIHLIPMLVNIYRSKQQRTNQSSDLLNSMSPGFVLVYEYCLNALHCYCSSTTPVPTPLDAISKNEALLMCSCDPCSRLRNFLINSDSSTLIFDLSSTAGRDHCMRHSLSKFPMLSIEYKHDPCTGHEQTLIVSKRSNEQEQKQLCFHLRRLLLDLHRI